MKFRHKILIPLFTLSLALNFRYIFNFEQIQSFNFFKESLSYSVFLLDLFGVLVVFEVIKSFKELKLKTKDFWNWSTYFFLALTLIMIISSIFAHHQEPAFYWTMRFIFTVFVLVCFSYLIRGRAYRNWFYFSLVWVGLLESILALLQFKFQQSVGVFFLGESVLSPLISGVAKFEFMGQKIIRGYGTFPHSNILGAFLLLVMGAIISLIFQKKYHQSFKSRFFLISAFIFINFGILISYSRSIIMAITLFYLIFIIYYFASIKNYYQNVFCKKFKINHFFQGLLVIISFFALLFIVYNIVAPRLCIVNCSSDDAINPRIILNRLAIDQITHTPLLGVGPGNFVLKLKNQKSLSFQEWQIQPVHNLYLQIAVEAGLLSLIVFIIFIICYLRIDKVKFKKIPANPWLVIVILFLIIGLVDHYFWTTPQGLVIFVLALVLAQKD